MILLDTDHVTHLQWGGEPAQKIARRIREGGLNVAITTIISYEEHVRGWLSRISSARSVTYEVEVYGKLRAQLAFYGTLQVLDFSDRAAVEFQRLRRVPVRIGTMDLKIAAIALTLDAVLLTKNLVDFRKVPDLRIQDATI